MHHRSARSPATRAAVAALLSLGMLAAMPVARAGQPPAPPAASATWREECGSCHVAYPPRLLPAASWRRIMATLDRHFGTDASIAPEDVRAIESFLVANGGRGVEGPLRITESSWFRREHREVAARLHQPPVGSPANCAACHPGAAQGRYDEDDDRRSAGVER